MFGQILCPFRICLSFIWTTAGRPQPFSPKRFFIGNQNNIIKIILFHWCGQIEKQAPNHASAFMLPGAEAYVICLMSLAHPPPSPTSLLPTGCSLESLPCPFFFCLPSTVQCPKSLPPPNYLVTTVLLPQPASVCIFSKTHP